MSFRHIARTPIHGAQTFARQVFDVLKEGPMVNHISETTLWDLSEKTKVGEWTTHSDVENGGCTSVNLTHEFDEVRGKGKAVFSGNLSLQESVPGEGKHLGFAGALSPMAGVGAEQLKRLGMCDTINLNVKGDGRCYVFSIMPNKVVGTNMYQAFVYAPANEWTTVKLPLEHFSLSEDGLLKNINTKNDFNILVQAGISLADGREGPFRCEIESIEATDDRLHQFRMTKSPATMQLKNRLIAERRKRKAEAEAAAENEEKAEK